MEEMSLERWEELTLTTISSCLLSYSGYVAPKENGARALAEEALFCLFQM